MAEVQGVTFDDRRAARLQNQQAAAGANLQALLRDVKRASPGDRLAFARVLDDLQMELVLSEMADADAADDRDRAATAAPRSMAELRENHDENLVCGFCSHLPYEDIVGCWCPLCVGLDDIDSSYTTVTYASDCVRHGMAPPHGAGLQRGTGCKVCNGEDPSY